MRRFAFRLALHLGVWDVDRMLRSMSGRQLREWSIFAELEPFGEDRQDARFGSIVQVMSNAYRNAKKRRAPYKLHECMLDGGDIETSATARAPSTWQKMKDVAAQWVSTSKKGE